MALIKFFHILSVVSLAVLYTSFDALPVNALAVEHAHIGRGLGHAHADIAKKRDDSKKCRPRPSSASQSPAAVTYQAPAATSSSKSSQPAQSSSSSQPAPTNTSPSTLSSKIMYAWSNNEQPSLPNFVPSNAGTRLVYNWHLTKYSDFNMDSVKNVEFVPTAHSRDDITNVPNVLKPGYAKYAKFANEPEIPSQANLSPQEAFQLWMQYFQPLTSQGYQLIGPAVTPAGFDWMKTFLGLCGGKCTMVASDFHYYGIDAGDFQSSVNQYHQIVNMPIWITECGCHDYSGKGQPCTQGVFNAFFPGVMSYVESTSFIQQVAWFGMFQASELPMGIEAANSMVTCSGDNKSCQPNSVGQQYINH